MVEYRDNGNTIIFGDPLFIVGRHIMFMVPRQKMNISGNLKDKSLTTIRAALKLINVMRIIRAVDARTTPPVVGSVL